MIIILQFTALIFSLIMIYFALLHKKRNEISSIEFNSWATIWILVIFIAAFPDIFRSIAQDVLVTRLFDLVIIGGVAFTLVLATIAYVRASRSEKRMEELVRRLALKKRK